MIDVIVVTGVSRQARQELAAENLRRRIDAKKDRSRARQLNRQGFRHNVSGRIWEAIAGPWGGRG